MECPFKCGWRGSPEEYSKHYETCAKRPRTPGRHISESSGEHHSSPEDTFTARHLEKLLRFRSYVGEPEFVSLFTVAGGSQDLAHHLWRKLDDYNFDIVKWYSDLDAENRVRFAQMLNQWTPSLWFKSNAQS